MVIQTFIMSKVYLINEEDVILSEVHAEDLFELSQIGSHVCGSYQNDHNVQQQLKYVFEFTGNKFDGVRVISVHQSVILYVIWNQVLMITIIIDIFTSFNIDKCESVHEFGYDQTIIFFFFFFQISGEEMLVLN